MSESTINIGLVDTGFISEFHIQGFGPETRCKISGVTRSWREDKVVDEQRKKLENFAQKHNLTTYNSFEEMIGSAEIDAVIIGSVNPLHYNQIMSALSNKKHVLIEKPVVRTTKEYEEIQAKAEKEGVLAIPAHNFACRPAVLEAKKRIDRGDIGTIQYASFTQSFYCGAVAGNWRSQHELAWGGALMDSGTHLVYQALQLLGMPQSVQAYSARNTLEMDDEDIASVQLYYKGVGAAGTIVHIMQNWGSEHGQDIEGIRIIGTKGRITISDALYINGEKFDSAVSYEDSFKGQAKLFADAIIDGAAAASSLEDAKQTMRIIDAAYQSIEEKCNISL